MDSFLRGQKVLICAGTGGVGKTTMSASIAVLAARMGLKTLVLTIDPAHRLAQALGLDSKSGKEVHVPGVEGLSAAMIDPRLEFDEFVLGSVDNSVANTLFKNRLYQQLVSNLNGSQEFTSILKLIQVVESKKYDLVILDTPPTQNAVDFLKAPERIYALFQESVIGWFADAGKSDGWIKRTLNRGTRIVTTALEKVTGGVFISELRDFFTHISFLREKVAHISAQSARLLHSTECSFVLVTGFDQAKLKEAYEFHLDLAEQKLRLQAVIINRWFPEWQSAQEVLNPDWLKDPDFATLKSFYGQFADFFSERQKAFDKFAAQMAGVAPILKLPDFSNNVQGIDDLSSVASLLEQTWEDAK